jgi:hypothetical protein
MLCRVTVVRTDVSEELSLSVIRVTRISKLVTALTVTSKSASVEFPRSTFRPVSELPLWEPLPCQARPSTPTPLQPWGSVQVPRPWLAVYPSVGVRLQSMGLAGREM